MLSVERGSGKVSSVDVELLSELGRELRRDLLDEDWLCRELVNQRYGEVAARSLILSWVYPSDFRREEPQIEWKARGRLRRPLRVRRAGR